MKQFILSLLLFVALVACRPENLPCVNGDYTGSVIPYKLSQGQSLIPIKFKPRRDVIYRPSFDFERKIYCDGTRTAVLTYGVRSTIDSLKNSKTEKDTIIIPPVTYAFAGVVDYELVCTDSMIMVPYKGLYGITYTNLQLCDSCYVKITAH